MAGNNKWNDAYTGMQRNGKATETETEKILKLVRVWCIIWVRKIRRSCVEM